MTRVLLVTGSRSLALHPGAEAWARGLIHAALVGTDLLIVGDADGPDAWACVEAQRMGVVRRVYTAFGPFAGRIVVDGKADEPRRWTPNDPRKWLYDTSPDRVHRTQRKAVAGWVARRYLAMVRDADAACAQHDVSALYLADASSGCISEMVVDKARRARFTLRQEVWTRGTEHTAGLAERAGIVVQREVWNG